MKAMRGTDRGSVQKVVTNRILSATTAGIKDHYMKQMKTDT